MEFEPASGASVLKGRCIEALRTSLHAAAPSVQLTSNGRARSVEDNLLPGVTLEGIRDAFADGAGHELEGKMLAPHSSSVLVVNSFAPWRKDRARLTLLDQCGFEHLRFEAKVEVFPGTRATPAHLDLLAEGKDGVIGIESKLAEILEHPDPEFSPAYDRFLRAGRRSPWSEWIGELRQNPDRFECLDAAQLVKHALALGREYTGRRVTLLYLYWESRNASAFRTFRKHREEVEEFRQSVAEDDQVRFAAECYLPMWEMWQSAKEPEWLSGHAGKLLRRYGVEVPG